METKQSFFLLLIAASLFSIPATIPTAIQASSSSDEEEEAENEEAATESQDDVPLGEEPATTTTPAPAAPPATEPVAPITTPPPTSTPQPAAPTTTTEQGAAVSVQDLISKYGANRTITLPGTGQVIGVGGANATGDKAVILTFDDNWRSQHDFAAPILENNDFNATFFIYCLGVDQGPAFMTAAMVRDLHDRGFDIESHSMSHPDLEHVSADALAFEVGMSKPCLEDMVPGLNVSIFATPYATGSTNTTVLDEIAKDGYEFARVGYGENFNIQCNGWYVPDNQTAGCQMYEPGTRDLKIQSAFNMPTLDVNALSRQNNYSLPDTQADFVALINDSITYENDTGKVLTLPILVYHNQTDRLLPEMGQSMLSESFAQQMQWLKDNGFIGLSMKDLVYHPQNATFTIPSLDRLGYTNATVLTNATQPTA